MTGWDHSSWGYHGDDGQLFVEGGDGRSYSEGFGTGDIVGCHFMPNEGVTFTKNGVCLGKPISFFDG
jgi:Ran-binding protein 9/10